MKEKSKKIKCPTCGKETEWENNPFRPFCSEKCKLADLHKWLTEEYTVIEKQPLATNDNKN
ncbi:DNA gyrase inhibitor YacG [Desulfurobacterium indicum]|uniref:DNA gyrase inhibitor YacG n=1 Tax=Desulfurobacterium indicum TaxID=1914305 RepID=A0A1R1MLM1_9BACT|nr:DNA gyrase inhibitor YacG [Desulfurobacterium indicum]OMH40594.1 DNA gyrase inhibitor YacG [Desulfurobacterium indicum]